MPDDPAETVTIPVEEHRRLVAIRAAAWEYVDAKQETRSPTRIDLAFVALNRLSTDDAVIRGLIR